MTLEGSTSEVGDEAKEANFVRCAALSCRSASGSKGPRTDAGVAARTTAGSMTASIWDSVGRDHAEVSS